MSLDAAAFIQPHQEFKAYTDTLTDQEFFESSEKWNAAEVYAHMIQSIRPVYWACRLPESHSSIVFWTGQQALSDG